jgi:predicted TIM-barrel fold metal-dependent hydrolase
MLNGKPVIDIDGHVNMECLPNWTSYFSPEEGEELEDALLAHRLQPNDRGGRHPNDRGTTKEEIYESIRNRNRSTGGWYPDVRLKDMDSEGIDQALLFCTEMGMNKDFYAPSVARGYNNWLYDYCSEDPVRLRGAALLPLGDIDEARRELRRAVTELGFPTFFMKPSINDMRPNDPYFHPLYEEAEDLNVPLMLHIPHGAFRLLMQQFGYDFVSAHAVLHPMGMMLAVLDIIYGGILDKFPRLRIGFMEGQVGWAPWLLWRLDEQYEEYMHRPGMKATLKKLPSEYLAEGRMFFSSDPEEKYLAFAAEQLGADHIVWASDYPHSDGIFPGALTTFLDQEGLTGEQKEKIVCDNPLALLNGRG